MVWANLYLYHPCLFLYVSVMSLSLSLHIALCPSVCHSSTVLSHDCFLWDSASFDTDHRGKCSLCSWDLCATTEADNGIWTYYSPLPPSFQWLVSDGVSWTCLTIWTALGMGKGWLYLIKFRYRASN